MNDVADRPIPLNLRLLPFIVAATFFMEYLDTTIIATALPSMARDFRVGPNELSLGLTAYMLTLAVFIPVSGWIADRLGSRTVFATAVVVFTLASVLCGSAPGLYWFTAARVLQGIGGAMMVPVGRMIVVRNTPRAGMMQAISTITWPGVVAPVVGPSVGGFITTYASWHWVFFLNVPFGIAALAAVAAFVPQQRAEGRRALDLPGFLLSGAALCLLLYGTEAASHREDDLALALLLVLAGLILGALAVRHMRRAAHPLLALDALAVPTYAASLLWGSMTRAAIEAVPYLSPLLFQIGFGLSPFRSGLLLLATATGNLGMKLFTTPVLRRFGFRTTLLVNGAFAAAAMMALGTLVVATSLPVMLGLLFAYGIGRSMQFTTINTLAFADVSDSQKGPASTLQSAITQMMIGMGIAFGALCLRGAAWFRHEPGGAFTPADFHWAFVLAGLLMLASLIGYVRLPVDAGGGIGGAVRSRS